MNLTPKQKNIIEQIVNVFETGSTQGNYAAISIFHDGPHGIRQVTYGRSQTTEYGNLEELIQLYVDSNGIDAAKLKPYIAKIGVKPLVDDHVFLDLLKDAGKNDPIMRKVQDDFFDKRYFQKAMKWADDNGFTLPLSALVIYDSFIHSGSVPDFLRKHFAAKTPKNGGDEKTWISQYVDARQNWLATASNPVLHTTVYRTKCFKGEIAKGDWDLTQLPIDAHGVKVSGV